MRLPTGGVGLADRRTLRVIFVAISGAILIHSSAFLVVAGSFPTSTSAPSGLSEEIIPDEVVVGFNARASDAARQEARGSVQGRVTERIPQIHVEVLKIQVGTQAAALQRLTANPNVLYAEPNGRVYATSTTDDPYLLT